MHTIILEHAGNVRQSGKINNVEHQPFSQPVQHTLIHNDTCQPKIALTYEGVKESCGLTRNLQPTHMGDTGNDM